MAIDRAGWYTGLVDDDNSGLSGTVWNKTQINNLLTEVDKTQVVCQCASNGQALAPSIEYGLAYAVDDYDPAFMHDPAGESWKVFAPYTGYYLLTTNVIWQGGGTGNTGIGFRRQGTLITAVNLAPNQAFDHGQSLTTLVYLTAGQYVETMAKHFHSTTLFVQPGTRFTVVRVS